MGLSAAPSPPAGPVCAGLFQGGARSSTGYAFQRIQRWARACAGHLATANEPLPMAPDAAWLRFMDGLFLRVLRADPQRAPALFLQLFARAPTPAVLRFLGHGDRLRDAYHVARSLPAAPFLRQLAAKAA
jgi:lycopene beta-cyclase